MHSDTHLLMHHLRAADLETEARAALPASPASCVPNWAGYWSSWASD